MRKAQKRENEFGDKFTRSNVCCHDILAIGFLNLRCTEKLNEIWATRHDIYLSTLIRELIW